jgi:hypothetical protein
MVKTDYKGVKQWDADFGGSEFDFLYALQQTADNGYVMAGYSLRMRAAIKHRTAKD